MPTFQEAMRLARDRAGNKESSKRLREILGILKEHDARHDLTPQKAVGILEDLGPTFVKLGQIASAHPDILPKEYCDAFAKLRANVAPMPVEQVRQRIEEELGRPVDELFDDFDDHALGSASIAQVHRARLAGTDTLVAVKVQRPGIVETVTNDLALMRRLLALYEFVDTADEGRISFKQLVDELERTSADELDFTVEAGNIERFARNNAGREHVSSPACYERLSTTAVLTMDFASGPTVGDPTAVKGLDDAGREELGYLIAENYLAQMLDDGFFHADPHAGNIIVTEEGHGIEWIDFGMMGELTTGDREAISQVSIAIVKQDAYALKRSIMQLARPTGPIDHGALLVDCEQLISQYMGADLASFNTAQLLDDTMLKMQGQGLEFAPSLVMLMRGLVTLEGTIHLVSDKVNITTVLARYLRGGVGRERARREARQLAMDSADSARATAVLPTRVTETLEMLQRGQLRIETSMDVDRKFERNLSSSIGYFTIMLMAGCLFVGSCILCTTPMEPRVLEVPVLGLIGFACGLALFFYVMHSMARDRRRR